MAEEAGAPLSRRVPGAARRASGKPAKPDLSDAVLHRMQAAIHAERGQAEPPRQDDPNTEPLPRVTAVGSPGKRGARHSQSPSGLTPEAVVLPGQDAAPEAVAEPPRVAEPPLRIAKALRVVAPETPAAAEPEPPVLVEPRAAAAWANSAEPPVPPPSPPAAEPPPPTRPMFAATSESGPTPGSIGWLWPEEAATQGGGGGPRWRPPRRRGYRAATLAALGAIVLVGAGIGLGVALHSTPVAGAVGGKSTPKATAPAPSVDPTPSTAPASANPGGLAASLTAAAAWVNQQVGSGMLVACDNKACAALTAAGFPVGQQVQVQLNPQSVATANVLVVDPVVRSYLNANPALANYVTPTILASFGQVTIQVVDPNGAAAYQTALSEDVQARIQLAQQLLNSGQLTASAGAETDLQDGYVDPRLLLALQSLADQEPIDVLAFEDADPGAGAGAGAPYRAVVLAESDPASGMSPSAYRQWLAQVVGADATFPVYLKAGSVTLPDGQAGGGIEYGAPTPLGLLGSG